jgi:hypothetical protein
MYYILVDRVPVLEENLQVWAQQFKSLKDVGVTTLSGYTIKTSFIGVNNQVTGQPMLFMSTVSDSHAREIPYRSRCATWDQAVRMHEIATKWFTDCYER